MAITGLLFSIKGKHGWVEKYRELESDKSMPPHSHVVPSLNAYMTDEVYMRLVPKLCKGIREMPAVRDHKDWWCVWSLDRFGSHVNVHISQEIFREHKIFFVKEEGDTSQVFQSYDR